MEIKLPTIIASRRVHVLVCYKKESVSEKITSQSVSNSDIRNNPGCVFRVVKAKMSNCILTVMIQTVNTKLFAVMYFGNVYSI